MSLGIVDAGESSGDLELNEESECSDAGLAFPASSRSVLMEDLKNW